MSDVNAAECARILLVEDEESHALLVQRAFEGELHAKISHVRSLRAAKALLADGSQPIDLVLTDLRLPDGLGTDLVEQGADDEVALVVMTSQGDENAAVEAMKAGALDYIVKTDQSLLNMPRTAMRAVRESRLRRDTKRLEAALVERERLAAVGTAAAMLAHEVGNPLNSMQLTAELLMRRLRRMEGDSSDLEHLLSTCMDEIRRLHGLVDDFRELSRQDALSPRRRPIAAFVRQVYESQAAYAEANGVDMELSLPEADLELEFDGDKVTQVLVNLIKNAIEAMPDGGQLKLRVTRTPHTVVIEVEDTGTGVPEGVNIFEPFKSTKCHGSGLGLAIVRQIVLAHGGTIDYESRAGEGSCFRVLLPLDPERIAALREG